MKQEDFKTGNSQRNFGNIIKQDCNSLFNGQQGQQVQQEIQEKVEKQSQSLSHFEKYQINQQINNNQNMIANDECETLLKSQLYKRKSKFIDLKLSKISKKYCLDQQNSQNNAKNDLSSIKQESSEIQKIEFQNFQKYCWNQQSILNTSKNQQSSSKQESSEIQNIETLCNSTQKMIDINETCNNNMNYQNSSSYHQNLNESLSKEDEQSDKTIKIKQLKENEKQNKSEQIKNYKYLSNKIQAKSTNLIYQDKKLLEIQVSQYLSQVSQYFYENNKSSFEIFSDAIQQEINIYLTKNGYEDIVNLQEIGCGFVQKATKQIGQNKKHYLVLRRFIKIQNSHKKIIKKLELLEFLKFFEETTKYIQIDYSFELSLVGCQYPIYSVIVLLENRNTYNFLLYVDKIIDFFNKNEYYLGKYIAEGGYGVVFDGKIYQNNKIQEVIFKIQFQDRYNKNESEEEFLIMKRFEQNINLIQVIDYKRIDENVSVILMEKCECDLNNKLKQLQQKNQFSFTQLLKIIFDLIDGLILLKTYKILHLDIKPSNILINRYGIYVISDFGASIKNKNDQSIQIKGYTPNYAPEEVITGKVSDINYESDVFSLGKTLQSVFKEYEKLKNFNQNEKIMLEKFKKILKDYALREQVSERKTCLELHKAFYEAVKFEENQEFSQSYIDKIRLILSQNCDDSNKNILFFCEVSIYYYQRVLDLKQKIKKSQILSFVDEIESLTISSLTKIDQISNQDDPECISIYHSIASFYKQQSQFIMEKEYLQKSLELCEQLFKKGNLYKARTFNKFALFHQKEVGLEYSIKSIQIVEDIIKGDNDLKAIFLNTLSWCYLSLKDNKQALKVQEESLKMRLNMFKLYHPRIAVALNNLGTMYQNIYINKSLKYQLLSLKIKLFLYKENHPCIARSLECVGQCYLIMGNLEQAKNYLYRSYFMRKRIYKGDIDCVADSLKSIARYYQKSGEFIKAIFFYKKYQQMIRKLQYDDEQLCKLQYILAQQLFINRKFQQSILISEEFLIITSKYTAKISKIHLITGLCQFNIGQYQKSLESLCQSISVNITVIQQYIHKLSNLIKNIFKRYSLFGYLQLRLSLKEQNSDKFQNQKFKKYQYFLLMIYLLILEFKEYDENQRYQLYSCILEITQN